MKKTALIVAAGKGIRMNNSMPKQFLLLKGLPILIHVLKKFSDFDDIIIVLNSDFIDYWKTLCVKYNVTQKHKIVIGGDNRFESVKNGLELISKDCIVAIHDGVRPLVSKILITNLISKIKKQSKKFGVIPILPIKNSICKFTDEKYMSVDRKNLFSIQTPQCFFGQEIKKAYNQKYHQSFTDDASVFNSTEGTIIGMIGEEKNMKITTKEDLILADRLL